MTFAAHAVDLIQGLATLSLALGLMWLNGRVWRLESPERIRKIMSKGRP